MCALIFACKKMNFYSQKGIDVRYPKTEKNLYNKKQFPGGPTCSNRRLMLELSYLSKKNREWSQHFQLYYYSFCNITASWLLFCWCFHLMTNNFRISLLALLSRRPYPSSEIFFLCQGTFPIWKEIQSHQAFSLHPTASHQYQDLPWHSFIQLLSHYSDWLGLWSPPWAFFS